MEEGDVVRINYVGRLKGSGELFDTTRKEVAAKEDAVNPNASYRPVPLIVGAGMVVEGLDQEVLELDVGERAEVTVPPEKAFGEREGDLIKTFSERKFKDQDMSPYPGMRINLDGKLGRILSVNSGRVRVDLNHPLAGKTLEYEVEVKEKVEGKKGKVKAVGEFYLGEEPEVKVEDGKATIEVNEKINEGIREELKNKVEEFLGLEVNYEEVEEDEGKSE